MRQVAIAVMLGLSACAAPAGPTATEPQSPTSAMLPGDRFTVVNTADRLADGTLANCRLADAPSQDACDIWREGDEGPAQFARSYRPGEALSLSLIVDVRPWTGALQPDPHPGQVEQVVLLGGEDQEACARLGEGGPIMRGWSEITACPSVTDAQAFFATLGDQRPRQSTWTLTAAPLAPSD